MQDQGYGSIINTSPVNTRMMSSIEEGLGTNEETMAQGIPFGALW